MAGGRRNGRIIKHLRSDPGVDSCYDDGITHDYHHTSIFVWRFATFKSRFSFVHDCDSFGGKPKELGSKITSERVAPSTADNGYEIETLIEIHEPDIVCRYVTPFIDYVTVFHGGARRGNCHRRKTVGLSQRRHLCRSFLPFVNIWRFYKLRKQYCVISRNTFLIPIEILPRESE